MIKLFDCKPRASGDDPDVCWRSLHFPSVNPVRAGMIPGRASSRPSTRGKPRASGDDPGQGVLTSQYTW